MSKMFLLLLLLIFALIGGYFYFFFRRLLGLFHWKKGLWPPRLLSFIGAVLAIAVSLRVYGLGAVLVLHVLLLSVAVDVLHFFWKRINRTPRHGREVIYRSGLIPLLVTALWMGYGYWNMQQIHRTEYTIETEKNIDRDLRIVQISDLHMGTVMDVEKLKSVLEGIEEENADILALTGDIFDESTPKSTMEEAAKLLGNVKTSLGTYYVFGNHDYNSYVEQPEYTPEELESALGDAGISVLEDGVQELPLGLTVIGRKDASVSREGMEALVKAVNQKNFLLVLDHRPEGEKECTASGIDLQLSGHTHAGQIWPTGQLGEALGMTEQNYGLEENGTYTRIVTSGIAGWGYPIRTGGHSEYMVVTVKKQ